MNIVHVDPYLTYSIRYYSLAPTAWHASCSTRQEDLREEQPNSHTVLFLARSIRTPSLTGSLQYMELLTK